MLPVFQSDVKELTMLQTQWKSQLDPLLSDPFSPKILENVVLKAGNNVINHKLGRNMQGWFITDIDTPAHIYRSAPFNNKTVTLTSTMGTTINLAVF